MAPISFKVVSLRIDTTNPAFFPCLESVKKSLLLKAVKHLLRFFLNVFYSVKTVTFSCEFLFSGTEQSHRGLNLVNMEGVGRWPYCFWSKTVVFSEAWAGALSWCNSQFWSFHNLGLFRRTFSLSRLTIHGLFDDGLREGVVEFLQHFHPFCSWKVVLNNDHFQVQLSLKWAYHSKTCVLFRECSSTASLSIAKVSVGDLRSLKQNLMHAHCSNLSAIIKFANER